jgi:hypothetical protein
MIRARLTATSTDHPAVRRYLKTGAYPVQGRDRHFSWDVWTHPQRERTPEAEAARAIAFISSLTHSKGPAARQPFRLRPWQEAIIRPLFGTLDEDGYRTHRTAFVFLPTRNGKTELAAAIMLYMLFADQEEGAELFSVAIDIDQAALVFNVARSMVQHDPELARRLEVVPSRRRILHHPSNSAWRVIASDAPSALGVNASGLALDELAAWPHREIYDVMASRTGSRRAPLTLIITTAGSDEHGRRQGGIRLREKGPRRHARGSVGFGRDLRGARGRRPVERGDLARLQSGARRFPIVHGIQDCRASRSRSAGS